VIELHPHANGAGALVERAGDGGARGFFAQRNQTRGAENIDHSGPERTSRVSIRNHHLGVAAYALFKLHGSKASAVALSPGVLRP
jgi:hypothetical protein